MDYNIIEFISKDNTNHIKHIILFFIFMIVLSNNLFTNIFGCNVSKLIKNIYTKHLIGILFLYLLFDLNIQPETLINPLLNFFYAIITYILVFLLLHTNKLYLNLIIMIVVLLIIMDKFKIYFQSSVKDQELLQNKLNFIYKGNNVFVILILLIIIIGMLTSLKLDNLKNTLIGKKC
tara:strand:+ start:189 stop:719 length:531 start_codon:yes stop_codon:yes gene_type:complete